MRGRHAYYRLCKMMAKDSPPPYIVLAVPATNGIGVWLMMRQEDWWTIVFEKNGNAWGATITCLIGS